MKQFWIIITISILIPINAFTQSLTETLAFADTLYAQKNHEMALKQYKRVLFFNDSENENGYIHQRLADCYFAVRNYNKALFEYSIAYNLETNDSIKNEFTFKRVLIHTLLHNYDDVSIELLSMNDSLSDYFAKRRFFYMGIVDLQIDSTLNAKQNFINAIGAEDTVSLKKIDKLFSNYNPHRPNPLLVKMMSIFIPGLGQAYIGDYKNAINSFVLSGGLFTVFMAVAFNYTVLDAFITVMPYFQRYYFGGIARAKKGAIQKQQEKREKMIAQTIRIFNERKTN